MDKISIFLIRLNVYNTYSTALNYTDDYCGTEVCILKLDGKKKEYEFKTKKNQGFVVPNEFMK